MAPYFDTRTWMLGDVCRPSSLPAADRPISALGHTHQCYAARDASPPTTCTLRGPPAMIFASASTGDVVPLPSLVVPSLVTTNDVGSTAAAASVA